VRVLLLGGTDLTLAVAKRLQEIDVDLAGVVYIGNRFDISYAPLGVTSARSADLAEWARSADVNAHNYVGVPHLAELVAGGEYDVGLAAGWYHMLPPSVRDGFRVACLGVHASLLPQLRGGAPLNWAILTGERETGVTLFGLGDGVDDGPVYGQQPFAIAPRATVGELVALAEEATLDLVTDVLPRVGEVAPQPQDGQPSYCLQRVPEDGRIDWRTSAVAIDRLVRAVGRPYSGARSTFEGAEVRVWATEPLEDAPVVHGAPGQVVRLPGVERVCVVTGDGLLELRDVTDVDGSSLLAELGANRRFS
jgi:methionyl-tRNA formyltransferase